MNRETRFRQAAISLFSCIVVLVAEKQGSANEPPSGEAYVVDWIRTDFFGRRDSASGVVVDRQGSPLVAGATGLVYGSDLPRLGDRVAIVAEFDQDGQLEWSTPAYPSEQLDHVEAMVIDQDDNVFIGGHNYRFGVEGFIVKYDAHGDVLWERHTSGPSNEFGRDVAVDSEGNAYLFGGTTARIAGSTRGGGAFISKYSPAGDLLFMREYSYDTLSPQPSAISVHEEEIFVVDRPTATGASRLTKMDTAGEVVWSVPLDYATSTGQTTQIYDLVIDDAGDIFTTGFTDSVYNNGLGFQGADAVVAKHAADGALVWQRRLATGEFDSFSSIHVDAQGGVYAAGSKTDRQSICCGDHDAIWAKFNSQGELLWQQDYSTEHSDYGTSIFADSGRNVYLAGSTFWTVNDYFAGEGDAFLIRYTLVPEPSSVALLVSVGMLRTALRRR